MIQTFLNNYGWIFGTGLVGAGVLSWLLGLPALLRILASVSEVLAPIARQIVEWLVSGVKDITDSMATILTVCVLAYGIHLYDKVHYTLEHNHIVNRLQVCEYDLSKRMKKTPPKEAPTWDLPFRWPW